MYIELEAETDSAADWLVLRDRNRPLETEIPVGDPPRLGVRWLRLDNGFVLPGITQARDRR
jgi:hypothetical protein